MRQTYDIDSTLYGILNGCTELKATLSGVVDFARPLNSEKEDVIINSIDLSQEFQPQVALYSINIHVPDLSVKIDSKQQKVENRKRIKELSKIVLDALRNTNIEDIAISIENQTTIKEYEIDQHYSNIRISLNIHS